MSQITSNLLLIKQRVELAALAAKRDPKKIQLLAVSKTFPAQDIEEAMHVGQTAFGENYVQEAIEKIHQLAKLRASLEWHFIGPLQSNKTREVAQNFDWVHSVDRLKIAQRLSAQRGEYPSLGNLQLCVQVNVSEEESKGGVSLDQADVLCDAIAKLPHVNLRGLMAIPKPTPQLEIQEQAFAKVRECFAAIKLKHIHDAGYEFFDTLSMGMSDDMERAIAQGSTMVRVGSAIFGKRDKITV